MVHITVNDFLRMCYMFALIWPAFLLNFKLLSKIEFSTITIKYNGSNISNFGANSICSTLIASGGKYFSLYGWMGTGVGESDHPLSENGGEQAF